MKFTYNNTKTTDIRTCEKSYLNTELRPECTYVFDGYHYRYHNNCFYILDGPITELHKINTYYPRLESLTLYPHYNHICKTISVNEISYQSEKLTNWDNINNLQIPASLITNKLVAIKCTLGGDFINLVCKDDILKFIYRGDECLVISLINKQIKTRYIAYHVFNLVFIYNDDVEHCDTFNCIVDGDKIDEQISTSKINPTLEIEYHDKYIDDTNILRIRSGMTGLIKPNYIYHIRLNNVELPTFNLKCSYDYNVPTEIFDEIRSYGPGSVTGIGSSASVGSRFYDKLMSYFY
jgi:hypothetical protein